MAELRRSRALLVVLSALATVADASWTLSADADLRYSLDQWREHSAEVHGVGLALRKTFSDEAGDRLILSALAESERNFGEAVVHELYARYKGPLGLWNITAGRFGLPYGLLPGFSTSRLLYQTTHERVLGFDSDNGVMLSGVNSSLEYALSLFQGYGAHRVPGFPGPGLAVARLAWTVGETDENVVGLSAAYGRTTDPHMSDHVRAHATGALDATMYVGSLLTRMQIDAGMIGHEKIVAGFLGADYALLSRLDVTVATTIALRDRTTEGTAFVGATLKLPWFISRGGYTYAFDGRPHHRISLQAYRLFSVSF